jgi:hypothetical protein
MRHVDTGVLGEHRRAAGVEQGDREIDNDTNITVSLWCYGTAMGTEVRSRDF